jgi:hypothetical protein
MTESYDEDTKRGYLTAKTLLELLCLRPQIELILVGHVPLIVPPHNTFLWRSLDRVHGVIAQLLQKPLRHILARFTSVLTPLASHLRKLHLNLLLHVTEPCIVTLKRGAQLLAWRQGQTAYSYIEVVQCGTKRKMSCLLAWLLERLPTTCEGTYAWLLERV